MLFLLFQGTLSSNCQPLCLCPSFLPTNCLYVPRKLGSLCSPADPFWVCDCKFCSGIIACSPHIEIFTVYSHLLLGAWFSLYFAYYVFIWEIERTLCTSNIMWRTEMYLEAVKDLFAANKENTGNIF